MERARGVAPSRAAGVECSASFGSGAMWSLELQGVNTDGSSAPYFFGMIGAAIAMVFSSEPRVAHAHTRTHMMTGADEGGGVVVS